MLLIRDSGKWHFWLPGIELHCADIDEVRWVQNHEHVVKGQ